MTYEYIGYHGTTKELAEKIINDREFKVSNQDEDWLGPGVYFFEDDYHQAKNFGKKARKYSEWAVVKSKIKADAVFDLIQSEDFIFFDKTFKLIVSRYEKINKNKIRNKVTNKVVFNMIYEHRPYDLVRGVFTVPKGKNIKISGTKYSHSQIQLCVRNLECIKSIEMEEDYNENK